MILLDANLLLYAYNPSSPQHEQARTWFEGVMSNTVPVGLAWVSILAFLRISTNPRAFPIPLSWSEAAVYVSTWLSQPVVTLVHPGESHWAVLSRIAPVAQIQGAMVTDAHLAALAIEHGATLCTTDRDFARFQGLRFENPLQAQ